MAFPGPVKDITSALDDLRLDNDRRLTSAGLIALLVPSVWFIQTDFQLYTHDLPKLMQRLLLRSLLIGIPGIGLLVMRSVKTRVGYSEAVLWMAVVISLFTIGINAMRPVGSGLPLRGPLLVLAVLYFAMPNTVVRQCAPPVILSLGTVALRLTFLWGGGIDAGGDVVALLVLNGIGVLTVFRRMQLEAVSTSAVGELRTLHGIIPICSHCRKLRTEVGDWQQLEQYFHQHSDTLFSHGICPDCLASVYQHENLTR